MKKLLYVILIIDIIASIIGFFALLLSSFIVAIIALPFIILGFVPLFAIISNLEKIEKLEEDLAILKYQQINTQAQMSAPENFPAEENTAPAVDRKETARGAWECVKCGTVNKQGTTHCSNCKADYSPWTNPTTSPSTKKKVSRWVK